MSDFNSLRNRCLQSGELYEDPDFPASERSLFFYGEASDIIWRRPSVSASQYNNNRFPNIDLCNNCATL